MERIAALVLAAGAGARMRTDVPKQFLEYESRPLFIRPVEVFLHCGIPVTVVAREGEVAAVKEMLRAHLTEKVDVVPGGKERYDSSYAGLKKLAESGCFDYVLIQDAARPFITEELVKRIVRTVLESDTAVAAVPAKDTIKTADENGIVKETLDRASCYIIQTPQAFRLSLILEAYLRMYREGPDARVTDDASVVERFTDHPVRLCPGDYENIKITTPEDLKFLR